MSVERDKREYNEFRVALLSSKFKGVHTERDMIEWLLRLCEQRNVFAFRALHDCKLACAPRSTTVNSIWESGAIYNLVDVLGDSEYLPP